MTSLPYVATIILMDANERVQGDLQGQARAHRIGQSRCVRVYRLISSGTYEQKMFERACQKVPSVDTMLPSP